MSARTRRHSDGKAAVKIVPPRLRIPCWKGLGAESEEKREPVSDIDTGVADSLKVLDPDGRLEKRTSPHVSNGPHADIPTPWLMDKLRYTGDCPFSSYG